MNIDDPVIAKNLYLKATKCHTQCWLANTVGPINKLSLGDQFMMEQGQEVGRRARGIFPGGEIINITDRQQAHDLTGTKLANKDVHTIYEATFLSEKYIAKADILRKEEDGLHLIEVKSGVNDKPEYIDDIAYTAMVIQKCGFNIAKASLVLLSSDYRLGMEDDKLFKIIDHTKDVLGRVEEFDNLSEHVVNLISLKEPPIGKLIPECRTCDYFSTHCIGVGIDYPVFDIPRLSASKILELSSSNVVSAGDIPTGFKLTDNQNKVYQLILTGTPIIEPDLKSALSSVKWPACYLDFETIATAIPLYKNIAPYTQIPAQFSAHICSKPGEIIEHHYLITEPTIDPRLELIEKLLEVLRKCESIIVYSSFEKGRFNDLANEFPDYADELNRCIDRLFDLEKIIKNYYLHPKFHGKTSIKKVMPVLIPDMSYVDLEINDGLSATASLVKIARGEYGSGVIEEITSQLNEYCKIDTLSMVKVHEQLVNLSA